MDRFDRFGAIFSALVAASQLVVAAFMVHEWKILPVIIGMAAFALAIDLSIVSFEIFTGKRSHRFSGK